MVGCNGMSVSRDAETVCRQAVDKARQRRSRGAQAQRTEEVPRRSEVLEGFFRSPRSMVGANGPHEVRSVPLRLFACCGLEDGLSEQPVRLYPIIL